MLYVEPEPGIDTVVRGGSSSKGGSMLQRILLALLLSCVFAPVWAQSPDSSAADRKAILAVIQHALGTFSKGDIAAFKATWAPSGVQILDDVPPYSWTGNGAVERWIEETGVAIRQLGLADLTLHSKDPRRVEITGDRAYVVLPVVVRYNLNGRKFTQQGTQALVMTRTADGWKTLCMSYSAPPAAPDKK
jgi:hypothetical protein